jgi:hypothetical protein
LINAVEVQVRAINRAEEIVYCHQLVEHLTFWRLFQQGSVRLYVAESQQRRPRWIGIGHAVTVWIPLCAPCGSPSDSPLFFSRIIPLRKVRVRAAAQAADPAHDAILLKANATGSLRRNAPQASEQDNRAGRL